MKVLMVDVDGVLIHGRPADGLPHFTFLERDLGLRLDLLQQAFFQTHWSEIIIGREALEPRLSAVLAEIAPHVTAATLIDYWFENDSRLDLNLLEELAALRQSGVALFLATNQEHRRARYLMEEAGLGAHVDGIIYSAALGHRKPSPDFFRLASERAGALPGDIAFIDDMAENIEAARQFGWHAAQWTAGTTLAGAFPGLRRPA
ncbi:UNVERIFIED_ORG: putative hydrolase of the HAD superfamily [Rhizobium esperanzae]|uniref:HAD superfamily hydrolase protein n=2 Tax=Rhizobium TaxID=379 RepID=A0A192T4Q1_9HYPH|nr:MULTISPECIES: HAD-IA family hydrolase [Rhizobium]ACE89281.1 putative haloacid dehydrogenase hydrolase protein [Rhizobium etli CIAT 652]MDH6647264.1 putative hydrolase of the HAD superfamily [Rhizobium esperanzae]ANL38737.1 HAD superfamily hydrolase protein [Rhizobium phaseoli]ANL51486.1 HAD superfamily hydrolase protein [Rhizobium phaseoli]ANL57726.1 HAD superfamily hydrolase protein [Rhizobium phaseoli]